MTYRVVNPYTYRMGGGKTNKMNAKRQEFLGNKYHSKGEAGYAAMLEEEKRSGLILEWERQIKIDLLVNGYKITRYYMDFAVHLPGDIVELREYKGYETSEWKMKWRLLEATLNEVAERLWPGKEVRMVLVKHQSGWKPKGKPGKKG